MGQPGCNVERALDIIGGKWSTLIIRDLLSGRKRFGELSQSINGISNKSLTLKLKHLEKHKVISKLVYAEVPPRTEYELTEYGRKLQGVIQALEMWGSLEPPVITIEE